MEQRKSTVDLNRQLEAYAAVAKLPEHQARSRWARWPMYAAATGAALAGASAASAEIIYSGLQNISFPFTSHFAFGRIDVDGNNDLFTFAVRNEVDPLNFNNYPGHFTARASAGFRNSSGKRSGGIFTAGGAGSAKNFATGARISGTHGLRKGGFLFSSFVNGKGCGILSPSFPSCVSITSGRRGHFNIGRPIVTGVTSRRGFLGIEFNGKTSHGKPGPQEDGWIRVVFDGFQDQVYNPTSLTVVDWAYNTDGSILAGQTSSPVPEPSTAPVMLLAAGAAGVLAWKRRRRDQRATPK
jgi:hypothetical protein